MSDYRKVWAFTSGQHRAVVQRSAEWGEFRVRLYHHTVRIEGADYHTTDRTDAITTARTMVYQAVRNAQA